MNGTALLSYMLLSAQLLLVGGGCTREAGSGGQARTREAAPAASQPSPIITTAAAPNAPSEHCAHAEPLAAADPLPGKSLYHLRARLTDQSGGERELADFRGRPVLVTMFYASCTSICPTLIGQMQRIEAALEPGQREQARMLLISLDPDRDDEEHLADLAKRHGVDLRRWSFTRTSAASVREIAAVLGIRYRQMPDGEISHSPVISLLDANGVLVTRAEGALKSPTELADAIARLLASPDGV